MLRSADGHPLSGPELAPIMELPYEVDWPGMPLLCVLVPHDGRVDWLVNTAYQELGYRHGGYHAECGLAGISACLLGEECGYDPGARRGPECAPARAAQLNEVHDGHGEA